MYTETGSFDVVLMFSRNTRRSRYARWKVSANVFVTEEAFAETASLMPASLMTRTENAPGATPPGSSARVGERDLHNEPSLSPALPPTCKRYVPGGICTAGDRTTLIGEARAAPRNSAVNGTRLSSNAIWNRARVAVSTTRSQLKYVANRPGASDPLCLPDALATCNRNGSLCQARPEYRSLVTLAGQHRERSATDLERHPESDCRFLNAPGF